ncbi:hypothetical protein F5144DRAFT_40863 [Chaetomium tenue]|uniref:Uncharacterized protein n=1 Tax=Chaetomium tenue TaxID=1854479 RepID=A0ACB7PSK3_9PEZI|nr:hypothetical protein F5144DRAFT_40863 [Chaetomium globosum]
MTRPVASFSRGGLKENGKNLVVLFSSGTQNRRFWTRGQGGVSEMVISETSHKAAPSAAVLLGPRSLLTHCQGGFHSVSGSPLSKSGFHQPEITTKSQSWEGVEERRKKRKEKMRAGASFSSCGRALSSDCYQGSLPVASCPSCVGGGAAGCFCRLELQHGALPVSTTCIPSSDIKWRRALPASGGTSGLHVDRKVGICASWLHG